MSNFAELNENNVVLRVIVVNNNELLDTNGVEQETLGQAFCIGLFGGSWKQTSYNSNIRKKYAGAGDTYNVDLDAFISPQPFPSWVLNPNTCQWESAVPCPSDGKQYTWDEDAQTWVIFPKALT